MKKTTSEILRDLELRTARLERQSSSFGVRNFDRNFIKDLEDARLSYNPETYGLDHEETYKEIQSHSGGDFDVLIVEGTSDSELLEEHGESVLYYVVSRTPQGLKVEDTSFDLNTIKKYSFSGTIRELQQQFRVIPTLEGTPFEEFYVPANHSRGQGAYYTGNAEVILTSQQKKEMQDFIELGNKISSFLRSLAPDAVSDAHNIPQELGETMGDSGEFYQVARYGGDVATGVNSLKSALKYYLK
tara:strand:+ start:41 stop:772 length:732 start_codon:yes stop_codon:yes gene_type:complete